MKIKSKLILAFLSISLTSLFVSNILSYYSEKNNLTSHILNHLESVASIQHSRVKSIVLQNRERLVLVASRTQLRISLGEYLADGSREHQDRMNRILNDAASSIDDFQEISVFALDGTIVASTDHDSIGTGHPEALFFLLGREKNRADLLFLNPNQDLQLRLAGPLFLKNKLLGVMIIEASIDNMISSINDYTGLGATGETVLARHDENGDALFIMPTRFNRNAALKLTIPKEQQEIPIHLSLSKMNDILTDAVDYRGIQVFAATRYVVETGWGIVVKINREEALAPVIQMRNLLAIIFLVSAILIVLVSLYIARSITLPVNKLTGVAQKISQGDLSVQADEESTGEIGLLGQSFNAMTRKLISTQTDLENNIEELQFEVKERKIAQEKAFHLNEELEQRVQELKQVEEALLKEKEFTETALNAQQDTFFLYEMASGKAIRWNRTFSDISGYTDEEISRMPAPKSYYSPEDLERAAIFIENVLETGAGKIDLELICKDGRKIPTEYNVSIIKDEVGSPQYIISIGRDITERKKVQEELQKVQKIESIGILAGGIAHDFNNILTGILNNIYLSKIQMNRESKEYKRLESAERAIQRATNLTQQLLTFSKGGAPVKKVASIADIIKESAEFVLSGSNVTCEFNIADNIWWSEVDEGQISQSVQNLILNASQAMPSGGIVRISINNIECAPDMELPIKKGKYVKISIKDEGAGISEKHLHKLFDPYFTTKEMGQGLGLSITYSIIKNHDGHISVESEPGVGTTFTIYLPASEKQIEEKESAEDTIIMGHGKILLMDDEEIIRDSMGALLTTRGYEIEYAKDGDEAVDFYQKAMETSNPFDAVILDLTVRGGMGGKEAMKKLQDMDPGIKAIVTSGYSIDPVMANFREYGFSDVLIKPCKSPDELSKILNNILKG